MLVESSEINQNKTHYDYQQGTGRIVGSYHYLHINVDVTKLLKTFKHITASYVILSNHGEVKESSLLKQAEILCNEIHQNLQIIMPSYMRTKTGLINGLGTGIKYTVGNPDANDLEKINNYLNSLHYQQQKNVFPLNKSISVINLIYYITVTSLFSPVLRFSVLEVHNFFNKIDAVLWNNIGTILEQFWDNFGTILGQFLDHFVKISG